MAPEQQTPPTTKTTKPRAVKALFQILFSLIVLGCAVALASYYLNTSPKAKPRVRTSKPPLVTIESIAPQDILYEFSAMGTVTSAREIGLIPRVSGEIISISTNMVPGGLVQQGAPLFTIDPTDYEITILQLQSDLAKAASDLNLEMGSQRIAIKEYEILGQKVTETEKNLMLRQPQLDIAKATVAAAEAKLKQASLDLQRTKVTAPFNGVILSRNIDLGSRINSNNSVAQLVGTDQFWVKVSLPVHQLKWLDIPTATTKSSSSAKIYLQEKEDTNNHREGRVIRLAADLETEGRMAVIYVAVDDPLSIKPTNRDKPKLFLGSFVSVTFSGKELKQVFAINRNYLHESDTVWLMTDDNLLEVKEVDVLARTKSHIYTATPLGKSVRLITSKIPTPIQGTPLQLLGKKKATTTSGVKQ